MPKRRWNLPIVLVLLPVLLAGCFPLFSPKPSAPGTGDLTLTVNLPAGADVNKVIATLTHVAKKTVEEAALTVEHGVAARTWTKLDVGDWSIVVTVFNSENEEIAAATGSGKVERNKTTNVTLDAILHDTDDWIGIPWVNQNAVEAGKSTTLRVTLSVTKPPADLAEAGSEKTPVQVFVEKDGAWSALGYLFDDGDLNDHGDEIKGDRTYSNYFDVEPTEPGILEFKVVVSEKNGQEHERYFDIFVIKVDEDAVKAVYDTHSAALAELNSMDLDGKSVSDILQTLGVELEKRPEVSEATANGSVLEIEYVSGLVSIIHLDDEDAGENAARGGGGAAQAGVSPLQSTTVSDRGSSPAIPLAEQTIGDTADFGGFGFSGGSGLSGFSGFTPLMHDFSLTASTPDPNAVGSREVLVWAPFAAEFAPWDETAGIISRFNDSDLGFHVAVLQNHTASVDSLLDLTQYGMVVFATHGSGGRWLATGEIALNASEGAYALDIQNGTIGIWQNMKMSQDDVTAKEPVYAVSDQWLASNLVGSFPNSIIVNNSCESTVTDRLWNVFRDNGAGAYFGYDDIVNSSFAVSSVHALVEHLREGETAGSAFEALSKTDPNTGATLELRGNEELSFVGGLLNGSFEQGLAGWFTRGDGRAIYGLGFLDPSDEQQMAIISTGLGFTVNQGSISQTFRIPDDAMTLTFDWNFLSEEFLEWIGSQFMDWFTVTLETKGGDHVELFHRIIDSVAKDFGAEYCESATELQKCIDEGKNGQLIHVSPAVVFDRGDVWMTDWQYDHEIDISPWAGQVVTLTFETHDQSDSDWDTAVLLDNVRVD